MQGLYAISSSVKSGLGIFGPFTPSLMDLPLTCTENVVLISLPSGGASVMSVGTSVTSVGGASVMLVGGASVMLVGGASVMLVGASVMLVGGASVMLVGASVTLVGGASVMLVGGASVMLVGGASVTLVGALVGASVVPGEGGGGNYS